MRSSWITSEPRKDKCVLTAFARMSSLTALTPKESMSERSPLNKDGFICVALVLALVRPCFARDEPAELLKYRTTKQDHGLYEIHQAARKFLNRQPRKKTGDWVAVGPDIRMQVPRCAVPLRTRWARESDDKENLPGVLVMCSRTIDRQAPHWAVLVSTHIPAERKLEIQRRFPELAPLRSPESK